MAAPHPVPTELLLLTAPIFDALHDAYITSPGPFHITNIRTAVALLNRGYICKDALGEITHTQMLYRLTPLGAEAYRTVATVAGFPLPAQIGG